MAKGNIDLVAGRKKKGRGRSEMKWGRARRMKQRIQTREDAEQANLAKSD